MLNKRSVEILTNLIEGDGMLHLEELADIYNLSKRSIRYDIDNINFFLKVNGFSQLEKFSKGVYQLDESIENFNEIKILIKTKYYIFSPSERINYIRANLYFLEEPLKANHLEEVFSISNSTVRADLNELKAYYKDHNLEIDYQPKKGFVLSGDEETLRKSALKFLLKYVKISKGQIIYRDNIVPTLGTDLILSKVNNFFDTVSIKEISEFIKNISTALEISISDEAHNTLKLYLLFLIKRVESFNFLNGKRENELFLSETREYKVLIDEIKRFESVFCLVLSDSELLFLTELLLGSHSYNFNTSFFKHWIEMELLVKKIIEDVSDNLGKDLTNDLVLYKGILNHLKPALYRIKNDITLKNKVSEEVKESFSDYFDAVQKSCQTFLEPHIGRVIPDEEIGYLTIHFKISLDKIISLSVPKDILIVCSFGYGTSKLLKHQLKEEFNVNIVNIIPYNEFIDINYLGDIDLIITTLNTESFNIKNKDYNIPVVEISPFISEKCRKKLIKLGVQKKTEKSTEISVSEILTIVSDYEKFHDKEKLIGSLNKVLPVSIIDDRDSSRGLSSFISEGNIKFIDSLPDWEKAVKAAGEILEEQGYTTSTYTKEMIDVIHKNGSYMVIGENIAIPHASGNDFVNKTGFGILCLNKPVKFPEGKMVNVIVPFSSIDQYEHSRALTDLIDLMDDYSLVDFLKTNPTKHQILELIDKVTKNNN